MCYAIAKAEASGILYCFLDDFRVVLCQLRRIISLAGCERLNNESGSDQSRSIHL
jgi:hypothetical protein